MAVALTAALARAAGLELDRGEVFELANAAHRAAQGGCRQRRRCRGQHLRRAAAVRRDTAPAPLAWPAGLAMLVVVTGTGSSTTDLVGRVAEYAARDHAGYRADLDRLIALAECAPAAACGRPSCSWSWPPTTSTRCGAWMPTRTPASSPTGTVQLRELAAQHSAVFKTSGAGGGDVGLAFSRSGAPALELAAALAAAGADVVPLGFGAAGLEDGI